MKRRRLDLEDLMVKTTGQAKPISDKPVKQFRNVRRPEITRLAESDPMPPPPANKSMGRGSGKDGRPIISDLIQACLAEERKRHEAFRWEESCRTSRIIAEKELEYLQQVQQIRGLSSSEHDSNPPPGLLDKPNRARYYFL